MDAGSAAVTAYIAGFPPKVADRLQQIRSALMDSDDSVGEKISYRMPAVTWKKKVLLYYGAHSNHIGVYPVPSGDEAYAKAISGYRTGKGTLSFPHNEPLPLDLIVETLSWWKVERFN